VVQAPLAEDDDMIKTFPPDRANQPFSMSILPWRLWRGWPVTNAHRAKPQGEKFAVDPVAIAAKADALARAEEAIGELTALGFEYELTEYGAKTKAKPRKAGARKAIDHTPKGTCPICEYATNPPHDKRSHRSQTKKKPFTDAELAERGMEVA
jgi:hypothetical protein